MTTSTFPPVDRPEESGVGTDDERFWEIVDLVEATLTQN